MSKKIWLNLITALALMGGVSMAQACTLSAWLGPNDATGDQAAGGPGDTPDIARYSGLCAMQVTDGYVQDPSPADETRMITRFYVFPTGGGSADIYKTFSTDDGSGSPVYTVRYSDGTITVTDSGGDSTDPPLSVNTGSWNSIEIDWSSNGTMYVWVNVDAATAGTAGATDQVTTAVGAIDSARLGSDNPSGTVSFLFDDYEARRQTPVGRLLLGDALPDGVIDVGDLQAYVNEILGRSFISGGVAQCLEDDAVDVGDLQCVVNIILGR